MKINWKSLTTDDSGEISINSVGEGVVWKAIECDNNDFFISDLSFKVKGEKHSSSRVKTLASVDVEKINNINELVNSFLTESRLQQGISVLKEQNLEPVIENLGSFLKWIGNDILKEETDTIEANNFHKKDVMPTINKIAKQWYLNQFII